MGTVTPGNLAMGPGTIYMADFGATEPDDTAVNDTPAASAGWEDCGATLGGITLKLNQTYKALECDQLTMKPESRVTEEEVQLVTRLAEVTLDNLVRACNGDPDADISVGSGYKSWSRTPVPSSASPGYKAVIFDGIGSGAYRRRVIVRKVLSIDAVEDEASKDGQTAFAVTLDAHYVSSAINPVHVVDATA
jgi:hypothetical protein